MAEPEPPSIPDVKATWNGQWDGATAGLDFGRVATDAFVVMFLDAYDERAAAAAWARGPWVEGRPKRGVSGWEGNRIFEYYEDLYTDDVPAPGVPLDNYSRYPLQTQPVESGGLNGGLWSRLQRRMETILSEFSDSADTSWMHWEPPQPGETATGPTAPTPLVAPFFGDFFKPDEAFRRRFPREIWSLSNPGSAGQVARFSVHLDTPDTQSPAPTTFPGSRPHVATPEAERKYAGQIFRHDGSAWKVADDQSLRPDVVELHGFAEQGDYFGPWNAEDIRDQLNRCDQTFVYEEPHFSGPPPDGSRFFYYYGSITITAVGDAYYADSFHRSFVQDDTPFTLADVSSASRPLAIESDFSFWARTRYRVFSDRMPIPPGGAGCIAQGMVFAIKFGDSFNSFGDGVVQDTWTPMGGPTLAQGSYESPAMGSLGALGVGNSGYFGTIGLLMHWNVEAGFRYRP